MIVEAAYMYDIPLEEVERIARLYPDRFYEELENYLIKKS